MSGPVLATVALAATAAVLLVGPGPRVVTSSPVRSRLGGSRFAAGLGGAVVALTMLGGSARLVALAAIAAATTWAAARVLRLRRERREASRTAGRVAESCARLSSELGAGSPPGVALERLALEWSELAPAAEAFRVGADVPDALRSVAHQPGAHDLRMVAAAWAVAHRTGDGLADAVARVARDLRAARSTRRVVEGELASARATAKLVAALPLAALAMGSGAGGDPWGFLLASTPGLVCLAAGLTFGVVGLSWIELIARDVERPR